MITVMWIFLHLFTLLQCKQWQDIPPFPHHLNEMKECYISSSNVCLFCTIRMKQNNLGTWKAPYSATVYNFRLNLCWIGVYRNENLWIKLNYLWLITAQLQHLAGTALLSYLTKKDLFCRTLNHICTENQSINLHY